MGVAARGQRKRRPQLWQLARRERHQLWRRGGQHGVCGDGRAAVGRWRRPGGPWHLQKPAHHHAGAGSGLALPTLPRPACLSACATWCWSICSLASVQVRTCSLPRIECSLALQAEPTFKAQLWRTLRTLAVVFLLMSGLGALFEDRGLPRGILNNPDMRPQYESKTKFADVKGCDEAKVRGGAIPLLEVLAKALFCLKISLSKHIELLQFKTLLKQRMANNAHCYVDGLT